MANSFITIQDYSEALEKLISKVYKGGSVIYSPLVTVWEQYLKQKSSDIKLPFISFFPSTEYLLDLENTSQPEYTFGIRTVEAGKNMSSREQNIKLKLTYYFEVVAQNRVVAEQIMTELVFWFQHNQQLTIDKDGEELDFTFLVDPTIVDNSNYDNYKQEGMIYRFTIPINTDLALFRSRLYPNTQRLIIDINELQGGKSCQ